MGVGSNKTTTMKAGALASALLVACMAAAASAADNQDVANFEIDKFCGATGFKEACIKSIGSANSTKPKDLIKAAFESTVTEIEAAIKSTALYKKTASDKWTEGALHVCEEVLDRSIDEIRRSMDNINNFEIGKMDHALDDAQIWLSAADTYRETCLDAFAKTKAGNTRDEVMKILEPSKELLANALAMVIEFQKVVHSLDFGAIVKQRQLMRIDEDEKVSRSRKLLGGTPTLSLPPRVTVALDGSGQFKSIQQAVNTVPVGNNMEPFVIFVKQGLYHEYVVIPKNVNHVVLVGEGPLKTRITGKRCFPCGYQTFHSATLTVDGQSFTAKDIAIENTAGPPGEQAVAVRISGDLGVFYNVHFDGYQDTLYPHVNRQLFRECRISGTIDFIFGNAIAVFQKCELVVRKPGPSQKCMVTAQGRESKNKTGVTVIQGCKINAEPDFLAANPPFEAYLGRPWKVLSRTVIMQTNISGFISPLGWSPWQGTIGLNSLEYYEYRNVGDGANTSNRVKWNGIKHFADDNQALAFTASPLFKHEEWIHETGVPYDPGFMKDEGGPSPENPNPNPNPQPATPQPKPEEPNIKPPSDKKHSSHKKMK